MSTTGTLTYDVFVNDPPPRRARGSSRLTLAWEADGF
jgi:hypothetical protein